MNTKNLVYVILSTFVGAHELASGQGLTLPTSDEAIAKAISRELPVPYTAEELAAAPAGEIRKLYIRDLESAKILLQAALAEVTPDDQANANYAVAASALQKIESVLTGRQQDQFFSLIENIVMLDEAAREEEKPEFVWPASQALAQVKTSIAEEIGAFIAVQGAVVPTDKLALFVDALTRGSILAEGNWEEDPFPISGMEFMIIDAAAVVAQLKTQPWQDVERFLGGATSAQAFSQYVPSGNGLAVLKAKYAANQASIDAKWNELVDWVAQERAANAANE